MKLLYIHNQSISPVSKGSLNTTMLQVFSMCNAFSRQGMDITLYLQDNGEFEERLDSFLRKGFYQDKISFQVKTWKEKSKKLLLNRLLLPKTIHKIVLSEKPDLIFTRESAFLSILVKTGVKIIYESHNARQHKRFKFIHKYLQSQIITASRKNSFSCLFTISNALGGYWKMQGVSDNKIFAWHDGFNQKLFQVQKDKIQAREELNLPLDKQIVTYTGGLYPDREIEKIIDLAKNFPDLFFLVVGGPEKNSQLYLDKSKENEVRNIHFTGFQDHEKIPAYLYASDVLLALWSSKVPTINYCSPLKLFEYMAAGRILLAHSFPTIREVLTDNVDAIFCEPDNFESMVYGLKKALMVAKENELGVKARQKAFEKYSWDTRAKKLLEFLNDQNLL